MAVLTLGVNLKFEFFYPKIRTKWIILEEDNTTKDYNITKVKINNEDLCMPIKKKHEKRTL